MDDIINIPSFLSYLTHLLKLLIYLNDDGDKKQVLIETYNKFRRLELEKSYDDDAIKKCLKRINLSLKIDDDKPVNIADKNNQKIIFSLEPFPALVNGDMEEAIVYSETFNINVLTDISLKLILSKKNELVWLYLRCLFYLSQCILAMKSDSEKYADIIDKACDNLVDIMEQIDKVGEKDSKDGNPLKFIDGLLNSKLSDQKIDSKVLEDSKEEMMKLLNANDSQNKTMGKIFDKLGGKIDKLDFSGGNILQSIIGIAKDIVEDIKLDIEDNPDEFANDAQGFQGILSGFMSPENGIVPPEMSSLIEGLTEMASGKSEVDPNDIISGLTGKLTELCDTDDGKEFIKGISNGQ